MATEADPLTDELPLPFARFTTMIPPRFRAWHPERRQMLAVRTISYADSRVILDANRRVACRFDEVEIMMECPIPDKHGNQLYESDLVFVDYGHDDKKLM